ncbi:MAG: family oxidoreductase [Pseudonocardiales bacterium]|nr:family oxidoreductase [Pseudonocardiales bacterium]
MGATDGLFDLSGKVALITGGGRGLGLQMARAFAECGADLFLASRKLENCEAAAAECEALGRRAVAYRCNAGVWAELDAMVDAAYDAFGQIDILVNNAGSSPVAPSSVETSEALFDKIIAVNLKSVFRLCSLVGSRMAAGAGGAIINISSTGSIRPQPVFAPYAAAKSGVNVLTTAFAHEFAPKVRVNAILPGQILTDIADAWTPENRARADNAIGHPGQPEDIITAALYLASPASRFTTGSHVRVDGGIL